MADIQFIKAHWNSDLFNGKENSVTEAWFTKLCEFYSESQRHYHTLVHIENMLRLFDRFKHIISNKEAFLLAIYFHDIIYDPKSNQNEEKSVALFASFYDELMNHNVFDLTIKSQVIAFINTTITHTLCEMESISLKNDLAMFLDFDMEVLSWPTNQYSIYGSQIRNEYSHYSKEDYREGRTRVLKAFLKRESIYFSDIFKREKEQQARDNIELEIRNLLEN